MRRFLHLRDVRMDSQLGPDGEKILDMRYYELLSISGNATPLEIKKAYRLNAIKFHPVRAP